MIGKLRGLLDTIGDDHLIIDVQGVGYVVTVSHKCLANLPPLGQEITLHTLMLVRQELPYLIGFQHVAERECFERLIIIQGVGPKAALAILAVLTPQELMTTISRQDKTPILRAEGVGPKLATRLLSELKDKVLYTSGLPLGQVTGKQKEATVVPLGDSTGDVLSALENLGYRRAEAAGAVMRALELNGSEATLEVLLKSSLSLLSPKVGGAQR